MKLVYRSPRERMDFRQESRSLNDPIPGMVNKKPPVLLRVDLLDSFKNSFGFTELPFMVCPNPKFFYFSRSHAEALNHLRYGIYEGMGFTLISGETGVGKTMLSRYFSNRSGTDLQIVGISHPHLSLRELMLDILNDFAKTKTHHESLTEITLVRKLSEFLLSKQEAGKRVVILLDEAQAIDSGTLEGLRLLSNLETDVQKLLHIVLFGQLQLEERLHGESLKQIDQRILVRYRLAPLDSDEIQSYVKHQLSIAGSRFPVEFTPESIAKIYHFSKGIPRLVNVLCERAMMSAFIQNRRKVCMQNVLEGWESLNGITMLKRRRF